MLVLQVNASHATRARDRCAALCSQVEMVRCGTNRKAIHLILVNDAGSSADELQLRLQQDDGCMRCVTRYYPVDHTATDITECIASVIAELSCSTSVLRVCAFPKSFKKELTDTLSDSGLTLRPHGFSHMLYAAQADGKIYWGVRSADTPVEDLSHFQKLPGAVCRAQSKLEEACLRGDVKLGSQMLALDVGAAPGGWSSYLAKHVQRVVAVDPGEMSPDPDVAQKIEHLQMRAQEAAPLLTDRDVRFDFFVCDANQAPCMALDEMIIPLLGLMNPNSWLVFTLKNCTTHKIGKEGRPESGWSGQVQEVFDKLEGHCDSFKLIHLMANTGHETTLIARII